MQITTSKGLQYDADWVSSPAENENELQIVMRTDRPIAELIGEFDGLTTITQGETVYEGYGRVISATAWPGGIVQIKLAREGDDA